jgi:hypothetical protein
MYSITGTSVYNTIAGRCGFSIDEVIIISKENISNVFHVRDINRECTVLICAGKWYIVNEVIGNAYYITQEKYKAKKPNIKKIINQFFLSVLPCKK